MDLVGVVGVVNRHRPGLIRVVVADLLLVRGVTDTAVGRVVTARRDPVELGEQLLEAGDQNPVGHQGVNSSRPRPVPTTMPTPGPSEPDPKSGSPELLDIEGVIPTAAATEYSRPE